MPYTDDTEELELKQRQIDAMEMGLLIARGTPRADAAEILKHRDNLKDAYQGDPGVNPLPGLWISPEGEDLTGAVPANKQEARQANAIARSLLGDEFSTETQWKVNFFPENTPLSITETDDDLWEELEPETAGS